jgi:hypothetical protein
MVAIGWVSGREEDHVIAITKRHELKLPNQITVANGSGCSWSAIQKNGGKTMLACSSHYLVRQLSVFEPVRVLSQRVNLCCVSLIWMVMQREYTESLSCFGRKKALRLAGGSIVFSCT